MGVLLPDSDGYEVVRPTEAEDRQGYPVKSYGDPDWTGEGQATLMPDRTWTVRLDPAAWPLAYNDLIRLPGGREVLVRQATIDPFEDPGGLFAEVRCVVALCEPRHQPQLERSASG